MYKKSPMKRTTISLLLLCLMTSTVAAQQPEVVALMSKDLTDIPGKEVSMLTVEYPPGGSDPVHRHYANAFVYVLEGSVVMQVKGGKEVTLTPGQTFYEEPRRCSCRGPERKHDQAGKNVGHLGQGQRRADTSAGQVTAGMAYGTDAE